MTNLVIPMSAAGQTEAQTCFGMAYANPDSLTPAELLELHVTNYILGVVNECKKKEVVDTAASGYVPITDLAALT